VAEPGQADGDVRGAAPHMLRNLPLQRNDNVDEGFPHDEDLGGGVSHVLVSFCGGVGAQPWVAVGMVRRRRWRSGAWGKTCWVRTAVPSPM